MKVVLTMTAYTTNMREHIVVNLQLCNGKCNYDMIASPPQLFTVQLCN